MRAIANHLVNNFGCENNEPIIYGVIRMGCVGTSPWSLPLSAALYITMSTLAQVKACSLAATSHYLNQCYLMISMVQCHSSEGNFTGDTSAIDH